MLDHEERLGKWFSFSHKCVFFNSLVFASMCRWGNYLTVSCVENSEKTSENRRGKIVASGNAVLAPVHHCHQAAHPPDA